MQACIRYASWQFESRLRKDVEIEWIDGTRLIVRRGMTGATGNIYCGPHEFADMAFAIHVLRPGDLFLDVGANVGSYTVLASGVCGATTIAFEPDPDTVGFLQRNIAVNGLGAVVTVHQLALSDHDGEVAFTVGRDTTNHIAGPDDGSVRQVRSARLDDIPDASKAVFMKLDVEGFEEGVLAGATNVLKNESLLAIESEAHGGSIDAILGRVGFERMHYEPHTRTLGREPTAFGASNALFVRDRDAVQSRLRDARARTILGVAL